MEVYKDQERSFEERASDLISRMTLEEKISQVGSTAAAIPRLGIPAYNYWSEAAHGIFSFVHLGKRDVTSFPVGLAMSQSWDPELLEEVTSAIADEARANHNLYGDELHFFCPTINMARDPRNGRSDENFGEDPYLTGEMAVAYIKGLQGKDEKYLKSVATPKHYALNTSENNRHWGSAWADEATIREYYAKPFETAITNGKAASIMPSYNRVNGVPAPVNHFLLSTLLREEWGFDGMVVSDCGGVGDVAYSPRFTRGVPGSAGHYYVKTMEEACALAMKEGEDMSCGSEHQHWLMNAVEQGLAFEEDIDRALLHIFTTRFRLGLFDEKEKVPYSSYGKEQICSQHSNELAVKMAEESIVLLKNERGLLPLDKAKLKKILVVGPGAIYRELGGYSAGVHNVLIDTTVNVMTLDGIKNVLEGSGVEILYEKGWCRKDESVAGTTLAMLPGADKEEMFGKNPDEEALKAAFTSRRRHAPADPDRGVDDAVLFARALEAAKEVDCVIIIAATDKDTGGESHDRASLELPYDQNEKIQKLLEVNENSIVVLTTLGSVTGSFLEKTHTLINAHFAGQEQGTAIARVLFGEVNPSGKLTTTWYKDLADLPHINDYGLKHNDTLDRKTRTYWYFDKEPLFPFGYGLSYTTFQYLNLQLIKEQFDANETIHVSVDIKNTGDRDGTEIVQLYVGKVITEAQWDIKPHRQLKAFRRVFIKAGEIRTIEFDVPIKEITFWNNYRKCMIVENGSYRIEVGGSSAEIALSREIVIQGEWEAELRTAYIVSDKMILKKGETANLTLTATLENALHLKADSYRVHYTVSDTSVLTMDPENRVKAVGEGTANVTASVEYLGTTRQMSLPFTVN